MKRILICGSNSYIGNCFRKMYGKTYEIDLLSVRDDGWRQNEFGKYDVVLFLAAVVHHPEIDNIDVYRSVNRDLPCDIAVKAVGEGVGHFIYMSSAAVYGVAPSMQGEGVISRDTECHPNTPYGISKLEGEKELIKLSKKHFFRLSIVRPPNVYGPSCPGNYYRYMEILANLPLFPLVRENKFSMIHVDMLSCVLKNIIDNGKIGIFCPQDIPLQSTASRIRSIARKKGRWHYQSRVLGVMLNLCFKFICPRQVKSLFGDLYYNPNDFEKPILF